jgi:hypothetical protein
MPLTNPVTSTNIASTFFSDNFSTVLATYYSGNKPFSDFDNTSAGGVVLGPQTISNALSNVGTGVITGLTIYNNLLSATTLYTNYRQITPRRGVTTSDSRNGSSGVSYTSYTQGLASLPTSYRRPGSDVSNLSPNNLSGTITLTNLNALMTSLYNAWNTLSTTSVPTITVTVCHSSCHNSCHGSRSRR